MISAIERVHLNPSVLPDVRITAALAVADSASLSGRIKVPHCKVSGVIGTEIRFELLLPDDWNNRFFMGGGGGYVGSVSNSAIEASISLSCLSALTSFSTSPAASV